MVQKSEIDGQMKSDVDQQVKEIASDEELHDQMIRVEALRAASRCMDTTNSVIRTAKHFEQYIKTGDDS